MKIHKIALLVLAMTSIGINAQADTNYIEQQVYQDPNYQSNLAKAKAKLEQKGYVVKKIDVDDEYGKPIFEAEAYKGRAEYDIKMSYPDLAIIEEKRDW